MIVLLAGPASERARLRAELGDAGIEIAGEFSSFTAAESSPLDADAVVMARRSRGSRSLRASERVSDERSAFEETVSEPLTPREIDVLSLMAEGLPNKAIAARLRIGDQTVKFHVASIYGKLGAVNRTDAVRRAVRRGLVTM